MKKTLVLLAMLLVMLLVGRANAAIWQRDALVGSTSGAIDSIPYLAAREDALGVHPLSAKDVCLTKLSGQIYFHIYDPASTAPESVPSIIAPDDIGANPGRWLRVPPFLLPTDISGLADTIAASHAHANSAAISAVTDAGSGQIITSTERTNLGTAYSHSQAAHAPSTAEQNVNADWAAPLGGDDYIANKPVIPTNNNQLANGAGYITGYTETDPGVTTHNSTTLAVHGIADTSAVVLGNDSRLTDARTPTAHTQAWSTITTTPTTLAGYGITDGGGTTLTADQQAAINGAALPSAANVFATMGDVASAGGGDMLKSIYDANADNLIDDAAIVATIARDSEIPTTTSQLTNNSGFLTSYTETDPATNALGKATLSCTSGQIAKYNGASWDCAADGGGAVDSVNGQTGAVSLTTDNITQGETNKYYTEAQVTANSSVALNTTHRTSTGADHTWLGQDLRTTATPTFAGLNVDGPDGGRSVSLLNNTVAVSCIAGDYRLYPQNGAWKKCENGTITDVGAGPGGDMLKSIYDANADNLIDDTAIAASIARDSEIPITLPASDVSAWAKSATKPTYTAVEVGALPDTTTIPTAVSQLTNDSGYLTGYTETNPGAEPALGNPASDGQVLSSTAAGVRSWVTAGGGAVDLTSPGPIGTVAPDVVHATDITVNTITTSPPATGTTDEIALREDPANGTNSVTLKAPANIAADLVITMPAALGTNGQMVSTNAVGVLSFATALLPTDLGVTVQGYDADLADLADGSLTGSKVGTGISATNVTTGTLPDAVIPSAITRDTEMTKAPVTAPTTAADACTAGTWAYDSGFIYVCVATNTWQRAALATW